MHMNELKGGFYQKQSATTNYFHTVMENNNSKGNMHQTSSIKNRKIHNILMCVWCNVLPDCIQDTNI